MPEPITTVGFGAIAAYLGKDGLAKILGPTAAYLGGELEEFTRKRINNIGRIFKKAESKLGDKLDEPGGVPPKVLKTIINEGSYSEDEIAVEYFGGVLASSRSEISRDDRGARIAKALDNLSSYQLRCHYLIYSSIAKLFRGQIQSFSMPEQRSKLEIFMPLSSFANSMGLTQKEWGNPQLLTHIFHGLASDGLIDVKWAFGSPKDVKKIINSVVVNKPGIVCTPTTSGAELFLWGFGYGNNQLDFIFSPKFISKINGISDFVIDTKATRS